MKSLAALVLGVVVALVATAALAAPDFASMQIIPHVPPKPAPRFSHSRTALASILAGPAVLALDLLEVQTCVVR